MGSELTAQGQPPPYLQALSGCKQTSSSSIFSGTQTVRKWLEICGHRPLKALILGVIFVFKSEKDEEASP